MGIFSNRRNKIVDDQLKSMLEGGKSEAEMPNLYFDAARRYAMDHGGRSYPDTPEDIIFDKEISGRKYSIFFTVGRRRKGTSITITQQSSSYDIAREEAEEFVRRANESLIIDLVLESYNTRVVTKHRPVTERDFQSFFETHEASIPNKSVSGSPGIVRCGLIEIPSSGVLIVTATLVNEEASINVAGAAPSGLSDAQRSAISQWQDEAVEEIWSFLLAEEKQS